MNAPAKLAIYGLVLAAMLGGGAAVGAATGPIDVGEVDHGTDHTEDTDTEDALPAGGLLVAQDGYRMVTADRILEAGEPQPFAFTIEGTDGPVEAYDLVHERELHLIVASRDLADFLHLHPERDADGEWHIELPALTPGAYRAFADFQPTGADGYTLGVDLVVPGEVDGPAPLRPVGEASVGDLDVELTGKVTDETESEVTLTVRRDGEMVTTDPYLGAAGHLVALRDGDLAYLHVHPLDDVPDGPVRFAVEVPSAGRYALFFDFVVDGELHTAPFVLDVAEGPNGTTTDDAGHDGTDNH